METVQSRWLRSRLWCAAAAAYTLVLLVTLPVAPKVWFALLPYLAPRPTLWFLGAGLVVASALGAWAHAAGPWRHGAALGAVAAALLAYALIVLIVYRREPPAKKIHLLEYAIMAGLTLQAVRAEERRGVLAAALFLFVVGTADEVSQGFIPMRTFRWLDLFGNYAGSALGALAWTATSPWSPWRRAPDVQADRA